MAEENENNAEEIEVDLEQSTGGVFDTKMGTFLETLKSNSGNLSEETISNIINAKFEEFKGIFVDSKSSAVPEVDKDGLIATISKIFDDKLAALPQVTGGKAAKGPGPLGRILS